MPSFFFLLDLMGVGHPPFTSCTNICASFFLPTLLACVVRPVCIQTLGRNQLSPEPHCSLCHLSLLLPGSLPSQPGRLRNQVAHSALCSCLSSSVKAWL